MNLEEFLSAIKANTFNDETIELDRTAKETALLEEFCQLDLPAKQQEIAWSLILDAVSEAFYPNPIRNYLSDKIITHLLINRIALNDLGHLKLDNDYLIAIYLATNKSCNEAIQAVAVDRFLDEEYSVKNFIMFIEEYNEIWLLDYLLYKMIEKEVFTKNTLMKAHHICEIALSKDLNEKNRCKIKSIFVFICFLEGQKSDEVIRNKYLSLLAEKIEKQSKKDLNREKRKFIRNYNLIV